MRTRIADTDTATKEEFCLSKVATSGAGIIDREHTSVFQKKRPFFWKKKIESIQVQLLIIDFHLRKVSVVSAIQRKTRCHAVLKVSTKITRSDRSTSGFGITRYCLPDNVRGNLKVTGHSNRRLHTHELSSHRDSVQIVLPRDRRPICRFISPAYISLEIHTPYLLCTNRISNRSKRYRKLSTPPDLRNRCAHLPRTIPIHIKTAGSPSRKPAAPSSARSPSASAFINYLSVIFLTGWRRPKNKAILLIRECI